MSAHTPGPWRVARSLDAGGGLRVGVESAGIEYDWIRVSCPMVVSKTGMWQISPEHRNADARLIAAAPDLLAALKTVGALFYLTEKTDTITVALGIIDAAIAKAEVRS